MAEQSEIIGLPEMLGVLRELPENLQKNALSSVSRAGASELRKAALEQLGIAMGRPAARDDVIVKKRRAPKGVVQSVHEVGPPTRKPQLRWLHNGTNPHWIGITHAEVLASSEDIYGEAFFHPGQDERPWLLRAYFLGQRRYLKKMGEAMGKALRRQTKILASKKYRGRNIRTLRKHFSGGRLFG